MSEEFYRYISDKLIQFFKSSNIHNGDKYFLELDDEKQVKLLYENFRDESIDQNINISPFNFRYENGGLFRTYALNISNKTIVVANSSLVTMDYLVTLRNAVIDQKNEWANSVLVIFGHDINDSIQDGTRDLQQEGMPLHFKTIHKNLINEVYDSKKKISKVNREIIKFDIESKADNYDTNLWDYEDTLGLINKGYVDESDLKSMKLFKDTGLIDSLNAKSIRTRLKNNNELFDLVESYQQYDDNKERLSKKFDSVCTDKLSGKDWKEVDYSYILQHNVIENETIEYLEKSTKTTEHDDLVYWERPSGHTKAQRRKRNIIVFNTKNSNSVTLFFEFDKRLSKDNIANKKVKYATVKGKKIIMEIPVSNKETTFARVVYKHMGLTKLKYEFNVAVVNCPEELLNSIKSDYLIKATSNKNNAIVIVNEDTSTPVVIGSGDNTIEESIDENGQIVDITDEDSIKISENSQAWSLNEELAFYLNYNSFKIPISIKEESNRSIPTNSLNIWNLKRQNESSFRYNGNKVIQGVNSFYIEDDFKRVLSYEKDIVMNNKLHGRIEVDQSITNVDLSISDNLRESYEKIISYYKNYELEEDNCGYPSLVYINSDLENLYNDFLIKFNSEIESIEENKALAADKSKLDLLKIGVFYTNNEILLSSLSPINMAYQLEVKKQLNNEKLGFNIINRINNENLIPFLYNKKDELFKPTVQSLAKEWTKYEKEEEVSIGSTNQFISKVIEQKINEFIHNFGYLFINGSKAPVKLNIINIKQDEEIVKGVFNYLYNRITKRRTIIPIELNLYNDNNKSSFDDFFTCEDDVELSKKMGINIKSNDMDKNDILHMIQNNITYYINSKDDVPYEYAHISFYKLGEKVGKANHLMNEIETGLSLNGIISDVTSFNSDIGYKLGFGTKNLPDEDTLLIRTTKNINELAQNNKNHGNYSYIKGQSIVSQPTEPDENDIAELYDKSLWVTFIEPSFGLEYFDNRQNLIIIHYSDQYTSSTKYDTITVTDKNKQYKEILKRFLENKDMPYDNEKLNNIIKMFNGINGEWLLRVISDNTTNNREKLSVMSAIKFGYALLNHKDIIWIPISMEEILRIAGTVGLSKNEGIFKKSLLKGRFSDDLLFIGINITGDKVKVYYHPIEVKQGIISNSTIIKAEDQLNNTINLIKTQFMEQDNNIFESKFYRNFFMQIALSNMNKLSSTNMWSERKLELIGDYKSKLLNDEYIVSNELKEYIGEGSVIAFVKDDPYAKVKTDDNIQIIEMADEFAYEGFTLNIDEICDLIKNKSEFKENDLLSNKRFKLNAFDKTLQDSDEKSDNDSKSVENNQSEIISIIPEKTGLDKKVTAFKREKPEEINTDTVEVDKHTQNEGPINIDLTRALIGTDPYGNEQIYWEYGNPQLSNRHMVILGKSGYGKTYFMQCLIKEMSKQDIPTLIIDYSDAFMAKEIQKELSDYLGDNLIKYIVKKDGFPLNPFKKNKVVFDEDIFDYESDMDISSRIKSVFSSVYTIGIVQENTLVTAIKNGLNKYEDEMSFDKLRCELDDPKNKNAISVLSQINEFLMYDPFNPDAEFEWSELDKRSKKVIIVQLHGYSKDIQKIITEFILWDLWNYKSLHGSANKPFNIILDEAQNLDFSNNNSPSVKILKEGRKFGWSAWFATQTLKGLIKNSDANPFNIADQTIYFHPVDNVKNVAAEFTSNNTDKNYWAEKLSDLKKGECISYGSVKNRDGTLTSHQSKYVKVNSLSERED